MALDNETIRERVADLWRLHLQEQSWLDKVYDYAKGLRGAPAIPETARDEIKDLSKLAVMNVLGMVRDSFAQNLSVVGYRAADAAENAPAWRTWQRNRMDARQGAVYRPALTYGSAYVSVLPGDRGPVLHTRSPRQLLAAYDDSTIDAWPQFALETWVTQTDAKPHRRGLLLDDEFMYHIDLGELTPETLEPSLAKLQYSIHAIDEPVRHGATFEGQPVCPVVRFVNDRDADDWIVGEVAPLIQMQQAINHVNFDRLVVSRFGAFPQKVITGWTGTDEQIMKAAASSLWVLQDTEAKAQHFPAADIEPYNALLSSMVEHVVMTAGISPSQVTGKLINVSADALAAAEATMQRKLTAKRESFGESWEQVLRLAASMDGDRETADDESSEVVWRDTETRSFTTVADGVTKLASIRPEILPHLLPLIPGITQQQIAAIKEDMANAPVADLPPDPQNSALSMPQGMPSEMP